MVVELVVVFSDGGDAFLFVGVEPVVRIGAFGRVVIHRRCLRVEAR
ncbi:MAG: hypothetical protein ABEN55_22620 [Bradymonadaceae bacterium]